MGLFYIYSLKVGLCLIAFYLVYKLLLSKETFHTFNRIALLTVISLSILIPWLKVTTTDTTTLMQGVASLETMILSAEVVEDKSSAGLSAMQVLFLIYIVGVAVFLLLEFVSLIRLWRLLRRGKMMTLRQELTNTGWNKIHLMVMKEEMAPFSWFHYIVISEKDYQENPREILTHEMTHIRLGHSWDVALCNMLIVFQWFNPAAWLLRRELQNVHEYEADEAVIQRGVDAKQYQMLLIRKSVGERLFSMANNLNHYSLKKRITMMTAKKSNPWQKAKALIALPMAALAIVTFANPKVERMAEQIENESTTVVEKAVAEVKAEEPVAMLRQTEQTVSNDEKVTVTGVVMSLTDKKPIIGVIVMLKGTKKGSVTDLDGRFRLTDIPVGAELEFSYVGYSSETREIEKGGEMEVMLTSEETSSKNGRDVFDVVEKMPSFPGGMGVMMQWIVENMKYPKEAVTAKQEGRVIVNFIVEKDGSISDAHIIKGVCKLLDDEAIRVVSAMPKWDPGSQNGKPVRVKYTVPISFKLDGGTVVSNNTANKLIISLNENGNKRPLILVDGKEINLNEMNKIDPASIKTVSILKNEDAEKKYGDKGKDGVVEIILKD